MGQAPGPDIARIARFPCQPELVALFETLVNVMFCAKDADLTYIEVNTAFVQRTGRRSKRDVIGRTATELFAAERAELYEVQDGRFGPIKPGNGCWTSRERPKWRRDRDRAFTGLGVEAW